MDMEKDEMHHKNTDRADKKQNIIASAFAVGTSKTRSVGAHPLRSILAGKEYLSIIHHAR